MVITDIIYNWLNKTFAILRGFVLRGGWLKIFQCCMAGISLSKRFKGSFTYYVYIFFVFYDIPLVYSFNYWKLPNLFSKFDVLGIIPLPPIAISALFEWPLNVFFCNIILTRGSTRFSNLKVQTLPLSSWIVLCSKWVQIFYYKCTSNSLFYVKEDSEYLPLTQSNLVWFSKLLFWAESYNSCQNCRVQLHSL